MKKLYKHIFIILIIAITIIFFISTVSFGFDIYDVKGQETIADGRIDSIGQNVIKVLGVIGSIASVVFIVVLGIKYLLGSVEEKAEYKKTMLPYFIGAFLVFAASAIASMIFNVAINL